MRFRGTLLLLVVSAAVGAYVYFYEIKPGDRATKAKLEENRIWKVEAGDIQQLDLTYPERRITAIRRGEKQWKITEPKPLEADSDALEGLAGSAADISRENVLETDASDLSRFGLNPAQVTVDIKLKDGKQRTILFGTNNPTGSSTYAAIPGKKEVLLVASYVASNFNKKLEDLRNRNVLTFNRVDAQGADLDSSKGKLQLTKESDQWWVQGPKSKWAADSSAVNGILGDLSSGKIKEFADDGADYVNPGFDKPTADVRVIVGANKAIKHLVIGTERSKLLKKGEKPKPAADASEMYLARDDSRPELFFVDKELLGKLLKSPDDVRDKALASFQRWDIDSINLTNSKGTFTLAKSGTGADWLLGDAKKKAKWDAVNGILDALEKQVKGYVDNPAVPATYGLDKPVATVILKQGGTVKVDCAFGKEATGGVYAQLKGEPTVKVADKESLDMLNKGEAEFEEPAAPSTPAKK
jgi:hypothetical protein